MSEKAIPWRQKAALRVLEASEILSVDRTTLYKWERQKLLTMRRVGRATLVPVSEIERILKGGVIGGAPQP